LRVLGILQSLWSAIAAAAARRRVQRKSGEISLIVTATTLAIAVSAPFAGAIADVLGRKRVIAAAMIVSTIPLIMMALAPSLHVLIAWRFALGLVLPPIFTVVVAYIGEEWPPAQAMGAMGLYMAASSLEASRDASCPACSRILRLARGLPDRRRRNLP
jgi:MFS family permease